MKVAILEIAPHGHYTYVESIAMIYTAVPDNEVTIFTNERGFDALKHLKNQRINIKKCADTEGGENLFSQVQGFDKMYVVTLEAYAKEPFHIMQAFLETAFNCPIYYVFHNIDFWFQQSFLDKIRNVFFKLTSFKDFIYRSKVYFYYVSVNDKIIQKVKDSGGKFVTLTESVGKELAKYVGQNCVAVVPFSVFDGKILEKTLSRNQRLRLCIPGYVSGIRRDYGSIFQLLIQDTDGFIRDNIMFDFLGGISSNEGGSVIIEEAKFWQSKGYDLKIYDKPSVGLQEFDDNLAQADIILGNLYIRQGANSTYGKSKESGLVFTMIKAAKVGLLPTDYSSDIALKTSILSFKNYDEIPTILKKIIENPSDWAALKAQARENSEKFRPLSIYKKLEINTMQ